MSDKAVRDRYCRHSETQSSCTQDRNMIQIRKSKVLVVVHVRVT